jgi:hypothetical protein
MAVEVKRVAYAIVIPSTVLHLDAVIWLKNTENIRLYLQPKTDAVTMDEGETTNQITPASIRNQPGDILDSVVMGDVNRHITTNITTNITQISTEELASEGILSLLWRWFGFEGWKELGTRKRIGAQILYRVLFVAGFAGGIIGYTAVFGEDPPLAPLCGIMLGWFLVFQVMMNFIFTAGSR